MTGISLSTCWTRGLRSTLIGLLSHSVVKCMSLRSPKSLNNLSCVRVGFDRWLTTFKFYNDEFKLHRKLFHNYIGTRSAMKKFEQLEEIETRRFLLRVLNDPNGFIGHIRA